LDIVVIVVVQIVAVVLLVEDLFLKLCQQQALHLDLIHVRLDDLADVELTIADLAALSSIFLFLVRYWEGPLLDNTHLALRISTELTV
jgi:hypothetical protein